MSKQNVVIIGGGAAGGAISRQLSKTLDSTKYDLILINPLSYRILLPATARMVVSNAQNLTETALVPLKHTFKPNQGRLVVGKVKTIKKHDGDNGQGGVVELENGETISYALLVLASGSAWSVPLQFPEKETEVSSYIESTRARLEKAEKVVLVGGGAVGIELAGEIKEHYPAKKVTIVHGGDKLTNATYPVKFRDAVKRRLNELGVEVILGEFVDENQEVGFIKTRKGKQVDADLVFWTNGPRPNTGFISSSLGSDVLSPNGCVKVKPSLQLQAHPDIFAAGDIIDWDEQKQAAKAGAQAGVIAANVVSYLNGRPLKSYKGDNEIIILTVGSKAGTGYFGILWGITVWSWLCVLLKSKGLLVSIMRGQMGA